MDKLLPPEILCDIFLRNIPHNHEQDVSVDLVHDARGPRDTVLLGPSVLMPLHASHVCRTWRHASISCGELWSYLRLQISVDDERWKCETKRKRLLEIFDTWLSRTNGHPINYMFHCYLTYDGIFGMHRDAECVITTLISQQHRWKDVSFIWRGVELYFEFPGVVLTNMPMLTSLSLSLIFSQKSNRNLRATISIAKSPELKNLRLQGEYELDSGNVPIDSLSESSFHHLYSSVLLAVQDCLRFLRVAPNLTKFLFITSKIPPLTHWDNTEPVTVPRLRILSTLSFVIDKLTLPSLEALLSYGGGGVSVPGLCRNFFQRSRPPLTQLELRLEDADAFVPSLHLLQTLKRLVISRSRISSLFFHELAVDVPEHDFAADSRVVCPSLVFLGLHGLTLVGDDDEACINALVSMVKSRAEVLGTFKTAEITGEGDTNPQPRKITNLVEGDSGWNVDDLRGTLLQGGVINIHGDVYPHPINFFD